MAYNKEAALSYITSAPVRSGQTWRHVKTGGMYLVVAVAIEEATLTPVVVYKGHDEIVWTRPLDVFLEQVDGHPRFVIVVDVAVEAAGSHAASTASHAASTASDAASR